MQNHVIFLTAKSFSGPLLVENPYASKSEVPHESYHDIWHSKWSLAHAWKRISGALKEYIHGGTRTWTSHGLYPDEHMVSINMNIKYGK